MNIYICQTLQLQQMNFSKAPQLSFFTSWYVIVNSLLILSYPFLRVFTSIGDRGLRSLDSFGFTFQNSIIYTGLVFIGTYYLRSASLREFLLDCLTIGKIIVTCLLFFAKIKFSAFYAGLCLLTWALIPYPRCIRPNKFIRIESQQHFDELVGPISDEKVNEDEDDYQKTYYYKNKKMFFVEFYADWVYPCNISKELWYEYSNLYTTPTFTFIQINVSKLPELAKIFNINTSGFTKQLPTIIILQDGLETARFPPIKENNKVDRVVKLDYKILLKYFDLQSRYLQTRQLKSKKPQKK